MWSDFSQAESHAHRSDYKYVINIFEMISLITLKVLIRQHGKPQKVSFGYRGQIESSQ